MGDGSKQEVGSVGGVGTADVVWKCCLIDSYKSGTLSELTHEVLLLTSELYFNCIVNVFVPCTMWEGRGKMGP